MEELFNRGGKDSRTRSAWEELEELSDSNSDADNSYQPPSWKTIEESSESNDDEPCTLLTP